MHTVWGAIDERADEVYFTTHYQDERVIHLLSRCSPTAGYASRRMNKLSELAPRIEHTCLNCCFREVENFCNLHHSLPVIIDEVNDLCVPCAKVRQATPKSFLHVLALRRPFGIVCRIRNAGDQV